MAKSSSQAKDDATFILKHMAEDGLVHMNDRGRRIAEALSAMPIEDGFHVLVMALNGYALPELPDE